VTTRERVIPSFEVAAVLGPRRPGKGPVMRLVKQFVAVAVVALVGGQLVTATRENALATAVVGATTAVLALLVYAWVVRRTERRRVTELAPAGIVTGLVPGAVLGAGTFTAVIAAIGLFGGYRFTGWSTRNDLVAAAGFMAAAAVTEELLFRGVLFRIVEGRVGTWLALVVSAALFGLMHLLNPHATVGGVAAIAVEAGGMLGAAYVATRRLWVPIGLHLGWNVAESGIFGTAVSGKSDFTGLVEGTMSGPSLLTGGEFGPEASLVSLGACLLMTVVFLCWAGRHGRLVPRRSRRVAPVEAAATLAR